MSANFTLTLANARATSGPASVVYTGVTNTLTITVQNNSGAGWTVGGGSQGPFLTVSVSANILSATGAGNVTAASPWTVVTGQAPQGADGQMSTIALQPPATGVPLPDGGTLTITLQNLTPSADGTGLLRVQYQVDTIPADDLRASAALSSLALPDSSQPLLVGDSGALRPTVYVNNGPQTNPIMITPPPATQANAVSNSMHFNLLYQAAPPAGHVGAAPAGLVTGWDAAHPPAFRVFFPYFNPADGAPAPMDLTDSWTAQDGSDYNPLTSAWNIGSTLGPGGQDDGFWQIGLEPGVPMPVWRVTPTGQNQNLFTATESSSTEPGPFLDWHLQQIVSVLIDPDHPETMVYLQWTGFPGFNDGVAAFPLGKTTLAITSFSCAVQSSSPANVIAEWSAVGADHCLISGDSGWQGTEASKSNGTEYVHPLSSEQPLLSSYTLTAVGQDGVTQVSRTVVVSWAASALTKPTKLAGGASSLQVTPDAQTVLVLGGPVNAVTGYPAGGLGLPMTKSMTAGAEGGVAFAPTPDGSAVFIAGDNGSVYGYDLTTYASTPNSPAPFAQGATSPFLVCVSNDSGSVVLVTNEAQGADGPIGQNKTFVFTVGGLQAAGTFPHDPGVRTIAVGPQSGQYYLALPERIDVFDANFAPVAPGSIAVSTLGNLAPTPDETSIFALATPAKSSPCITKIDGTTLRVVKQLPVALVDFEFLPLTALGVSADNAILFLIGPTAVSNAGVASTFRAYSAATLAELPWSPLNFGSAMPVDLAVSPDGSRLFALVVTDFGEADAHGTPLAVMWLYAVDPTFS